MPDQDLSLEKLISVVLRGGVLLSAALIVLGGLIVAGQGGLGHTAASSYPHSFGDVITGVGHGDGVAIMTLGLVTLLATPIVRVALSLVGFARERDWRFVVMTAVVLIIITVSLLLGKAGS